MSLRDKFTTAYIEAALFTSNDESDESGGEALNKNYTADDIDEEAMAEIMTDCAKFQKENAALLLDWGEEQAGHDFWLTRNGHGAGYWDRGLPNGDELTKAAKKFGEATLYLGDDGVIYQAVG